MTELPKEYENKIICGDNLEILQLIPDSCVDLIYGDPPFQSDQTYAIIWGNGYEVKAFEDTWKGGIHHYIEMMRPRIEQCWRVLKESGTFYLHCDWHASHYLKVMCDDIFGYDNFKNECMWCYGGGGIPKMDFPRKHDIILRYIKDQKEFKKHGVFNTQRKPYGLWTKDHEPRHSLTSGGGKLDMEKGTPITDWWDDIKSLTSYQSEWLGFPTQKPLALLDRIVKVSSRKGQVVLDPFLGGGTTIVKARDLKRKYVGIDVSPIGCVVSLLRLKGETERIKQYRKRLEDLVGKVRPQDLLEIINYPMDKDDVKKMDGFQFQQWIIIQLGASISPTYTDDKGVDGTFFDGTPIEVKKSTIGRPAVQKFESAIRDQKRKIGVMVGLSFPATSVEYVAKMKGRGINVILITLDEIISGEWTKLVTNAGVQIRPKNLRNHVPKE